MRAGTALGVERASGLFLSGGILYQASGWVGMTLEASVGALRGRTEGAIDRDAAQVSLSAGIPATAWLTVDGGVQWRVYSTVFAQQRWSVLRVGAEARLPFLGGSAAGVARLHYLPSVSVRGLGPPDLALAAAAGMEYRIGPATLDVFYDLERVDFPERSGVRRLEELSSLSVRLGLRLGR